jgi:hypothetical protein
MALCIGQYHQGDVVDDRDEERMRGNQIIFSILLVYGLFDASAANDQDSIVCGSHEVTSVVVSVASANSIKSVGEGISIDQNRRMVGLNLMLKRIWPQINLKDSVHEELYHEFNAAREAYYESVPFHLHSPLEAYSKAKDNEDSTHMAYKTHMDKYRSYDNKKRKILDDLLSTVIKLDSVEFDLLTKLGNFARIIKERFHHQIDIKAILNADLPTDNSDFSKLIEHIRQYRTVNEQFTNRRAILSRACDIARSSLNTSFDIYYRAKYPGCDTPRFLNRFNSDLKAYNRFFIAKNAFESCESIARLRECSKEMNEHIKTL